MSVFDVLTEGLKHISQLQSITQEVDKEVLPHYCCDVKLLEVCWCVEWHGLYRPVEFLIRVQTLIYGNSSFLRKEGDCLIIISI